MKLMTKEIESQMPKLYETENIKNKMAMVKYFNPCGAQTWYGIEYDKEDRLFYGYVDFYGDGFGEYGYFSLDELESVKLPFGLGIERDLYFNPTPMSNIK